MNVLTQFVDHKHTYLTKMEDQTLLSLKFIKKS